MNGRSGKNPWKPNRTSWVSKDDGTTFSRPFACPIVEDASAGCSGGLVADPSGSSSINRLFFSEPAGPKRIGLKVHCSLDGGRTWPYSMRVGGKNDVAAYSALRMVETNSGERKLLVVWESKPNFLYTRIDTDWCSNSTKSSK